jgi:hypothetical protein
VTFLKGEKPAPAMTGNGLLDPEHLGGRLDSKSTPSAAYRQANNKADAFERTREQTRTRGVTIESIMTHANFRLGVEDARAGRHPRFDESFGCWEYERGRLFACVAPVNMPVFIGRSLNPKAVALCYAAHKRGLIR